MDPIVNHNQAAAAHQHDFFGAKSWQGTFGNGADYNDVRGSATTCREQKDTAAYWAPSLVFTSGPKAGQRVPPVQFTAYYRAFASQSSGQGRPFPPDTRLVATDEAGYGLTGWTCGQASRQAAVQGGVGFIPDCTGEDGSPGNTLTAHVNFPSCWNGVLPNHTPGDVGDTRDNANYAYPANKTACPAAFPIEMVQLRETIQYAYTGNGADVALTSDHGMRSGTEMHVDFWNTWDQAGFEDMVRTCITVASAYSAARCDP
ncbi:DUF1996 domain-containing protein [Knoellia sp. CPCC 206453]|uniref:DUF1996 domain-containing protein n=1 Tax=Knoellia pratensis TaxID=3404796 RepID=UPI00361305FF